MIGWGGSSVGLAVVCPFYAFVLAVVFSVVGLVSRFGSWWVVFFGVGFSGGVAECRGAVCGGALFFVVYHFVLRAGSFFL